METKIYRHLLVAVDFEPESERLADEPMIGS